MGNSPQTAVMQKLYWRYFRNDNFGDAIFKTGHQLDEAVWPHVGKTDLKNAITTQLIEDYYSD